MKKGNRSKWETRIEYPNRDKFYTERFRKVTRPSITPAYVEMIR